MTRSLTNLTIVMLATLALGGAAAHGQTKPPSNCGVETWSTDQMAYVGTPCPAGTIYENPGATK